MAGTLWPGTGWWSRGWFDDCPFLDEAPLWVAAQLFQPRPAGERVVLRYLPPPPPRDAQVGSASAELIFKFLIRGVGWCVSLRLTVIQVNLPQGHTHTPPSIMDLLSRDCWAGVGYSRSVGTCLWTPSDKGRLRHCSRGPTKGVSSGRSASTAYASVNAIDPCLPLCLESGCRSVPTVHSPRPHGSTEPPGVPPTPSTPPWMGVKWPPAETTFRSPVPARGWLHGGDEAKGKRKEAKGKRKEERGKRKEKRKRVTGSWICHPVVALACTRRTPMDPACPLASWGLGSRFRACSSTLQWCGRFFFRRSWGGAAVMSPAPVAVAHSPFFAFCPPLGPSRPSIHSHPHEPRTHGTRTHSLAVAVV